MKLARIMIVALALTLLAASTSFGAVIAFRTGTLNEIAVNAQTGLVGNIGLVPLVAGTIPAGEIVNINFSAPISSVSDLRIVIAGVEYDWPSESFSSTPVILGPASVTVDANHIAIGFNAVQDAAAGATIIEVRGVRVNVCPGGSVDQRISAVITSALGQVAVTDPDVDVAVLREPISVTLFSSSDDLTTRGGSATATVRITELFTNAFETKSPTSPTQIRLALTVPADLALASASIAAAVPVFDTTDLMEATIVSVAGANPVLINITGQDPNALERIDVTLNFNAINPPIPLNLGDVTVQATFQPQYTSTQFPVALGIDNAATTTVVEGRLGYCARLRPEPALLISFGADSLQTRLLSTFNVTDGTFETGFSILNASAIFTDSTAGQPGTITYTLYPYNAAPLGPFTTSATFRPGIGLDANGSLPEGNSWNVLLSQLLPAGTTSFRGAVVFTTNFTGGEGINFIADDEFEVQAQGYQMLVIGGDMDRILASGGFFD